MNTRNAPFAPSSVLDVEARGKPIDVLIVSARVVASESSDARVGRHSSRCRTIGKRESRRADLLVYRRRPFITNPDLRERFRLDAPLERGDVRTFYCGGDRGYMADLTLAEQGWSRHLCDRLTPQTAEWRQALQRGTGEN